MCVKYFVTNKSVLTGALILWGLLTLQCNKAVSDNESKKFPLAAEQDIDVEQLALAFEKAARIEDLQGLAISRNNIIVAEEYYSEVGPEPDPLLHVMSVTKSITSTLVGIAIDNGFIADTEQTVFDFFGAEVDTVNTALGNVTLHQLLTMTCGHDWHEIGTYSEFGDFVNAPDQLTYIFEKPVVNTPGTLFNYSDGAAHLVSAILEKGTGMSTADFASQYLFTPLEIGPRIWYADNRSIAYGGVGLCIGFHDMIKMGHLYLNNGYYKDQQVVSSEWIERAIQQQISTNNIIPFLKDYGYYWWLGDAHGHDFICANGYGGQFIVVVQNLNLVICSRSNYRNRTREEADNNWYQILDLILNDILPAVY